MGVYHLAGLGTSIGAVTAAFSYLGARKERVGLHQDDPLFALSGEAQDEAGTRGSVEALVLFTTREIIEDRIRCEVYKDNLAGTFKGPERTNQPIHKTLKAMLRELLRPLARVEKSDGRLKPLLLYWCEYERNRPVQTFERAAQVLYATKPPGKVGKEIWINLTGGSNIINGALQLAASLTGTAAKQYYLLSDDPQCIRHTVPTSFIGTDQDRFWVDLPLVYLDFNPIQRIVLDLLSQFEDIGPLTLHDLHQYLGEKLYSNPLLRQGPAVNQDVFVHGYLRPLRAQELILYEPNDSGEEQYQIGPRWSQMSRYLNALPDQNDEDAPYSLVELEKRVSWLTKETLLLD